MTLVLITASSVVRDLRNHWMIYAAMPVMAALIGYVTKVLAVEMMFRPLKFKGIPPFLGWQGVIPKGAARIASVTMELLLSKLVDPSELIDRIDLNELQRELEIPMRQFADEMTRAVMPRLMPLAWGAMPEAGRKLVVSRVTRSIPQTLERLTSDLRTDFDSVIDLRMMTVDALVRDPSKTVQLIRTVGRNELKFIIKMGAPFGFILGLFQAIAWALTHNPWIMPAFGAVTGSVTDWLAIQMIFRPVRRERYLLVLRWQGLFHRRRAEVTRDYANIVARELITPSNVLEHLLDGPRSDRFMEFIDREISAAVDGQMGIARPLLTARVGTSNYTELKSDVAAHVVAVMRSGSGGDLDSVAPLASSIWRDSS